VTSTSLVAHLGFHLADSVQRDSHAGLADSLRRPYRRLVAATLQFITAYVQPESSTVTGRDLKGQSPT
jgi:hypothetical protein